MQVNSKTDNRALVPFDLSPDSERKFFHRLSNILSGSEDEIIIDCTLLERVTSSHINLLWRIHSRCSEAGNRVKYSSVSVNLKRVLMMLDLYDLIIGERIGFTELTGHDMPVRNIKVDKKLHLEFTSEEGDIGNAVEEFRKFLGSLKLPEFTAFELETVFYEVITNIKLHSQIPTGSIVKALVTITKEGLEMCFIDRGEPFDPVQQPSDFDPNIAAGKQQKRGYGLIMIKRMMDEIIYERQDDCLNVLTLKKNWR